MQKNVLQKNLVVNWGRKKPKPDISYIDPSFRHRHIGNALLDLKTLSLPQNKDPYWNLGDAGGRTNNYLPIEGHGRAIFYNKPLFEKAGIRLPKGRLLNSDEFLEIIKKLRHNNITPIAEGAANREWKAAIPIVNTMIRYAGHDKMHQLIRREINFSDPDIIRSLKYWKKIIDAGGYDCSKSLRLGLSDGILEMIEGRAAISFCDTWIYSTFGAAGAARSKYGRVGVLDWFNVPDGKGNNTFDYTLDAGYGVNRYSPSVELAKQYLQYLITPHAAKLWTRHVQSPYPISLPNWPADSFYGELAAQRRNQKQMKGIGYLFLPTPALNNMWSNVTKEFICGRISVDDFVRRMNSRF
ncbi:MAG: extracellular solute-binding protein [Desulfobacterales bacterium]|jgi:ABC-type glycerol-3-phosphate transport system substrate-binding protein